MSMTPSHFSPVSAPPSVTHGRLPEPHHHHHRSIAGADAILVNPRVLPLLKLMVFPLVQILPDGKDEVFGYRVKLPHEAFAPTATTPMRFFENKTDANAAALTLLGQEPKDSIDRMLEQEAWDAKRRERAEQPQGRILDRLKASNRLADAPKPVLKIRIPKVDIDA